MFCEENEAANIKQNEHPEAYSLSVAHFVNNRKYVGTYV